MTSAHTMIQYSELFDWLKVTNMVHKLLKMSNLLPILFYYIKYINSGATQSYMAFYH